ncbi:hypothetical protein BTUL_0074g00160 [Botrytis tulipae]|uniref:Uncharacterized protein n=1 Tax=Botrytis tulipae TaxID=87230 RepID=A0A4Z1ENK7_9HELO|nr:hypothetical protein BTUL_0074g00160 [Botrytis tulipae]
MAEDWQATPHYTLPASLETFEWYPAHLHTSRQKLLHAIKHNFECYLSNSDRRKGATRLSTVTLAESQAKPNMFGIGYKDSVI